MRSTNSNFVQSTKPLLVRRSSGRQASGIIAVAAGDYHTLGLKANGTVVSTEIILFEYNNYHEQDKVSDWTDLRVPQ